MKTEIPNGIELLQRLIQFDTTNPPGNERDCITYISQLLGELGIESTLLGLTPERPNLIARIRGEGRAAPLLLYGHADVVTTHNQEWRYPPFEGRVTDGYIWGRGALDMKGCVTMMLLAVMQAKAEGVELPGDVILAVVCDEEEGGVYGSRFLVEEHPGLFEGVRYALGEFGGFSLSLANKCFYPIQVAEKQGCWMKATFHGAGGHGSMPVRRGAMAKLADTLRELDQHKFPVHITPGARLMFGSIAAELGGASGFVLKQLTNPLLADSVIGMLGERGRLFSPLIRNTVSPTMLSASEKINVIPSEVSVGLDGRLLPGFAPQDFIQELRKLTGDDVEFEVILYDPCSPKPDMGWFDTLAGILREADPQGVPIPYMLSAVTDARFFSRLGIQTYGFTPMQLPDDFNFSEAAHAANERIPVEAVEFGANAIYKAIQRTI
jgi:acetylornithine deacetylase/succinyl-diaminopimelate desuccinylase-like protein